MSRVSSSSSSPTLSFCLPPHLPRTFKQRLPTSQIVSSRSLHNRNLEPSTQTPASELYAFSLPWWAGRWGGSPWPQGSSVFFPQHRKARGLSRDSQSCVHLEWAWPEWGGHSLGINGAVRPSILGSRITTPTVELGHYLTGNSQESTQQREP